jgi:hypothetical protein
MKRLMLATLLSLVAATPAAAASTIWLHYQVAWSPSFRDGKWERLETATAIRDDWCEEIAFTMNVKEEARPSTDLERQHGRFVTTAHCLPAGIDPSRR